MLYFTKGLFDALTLNAKFFLTISVQTSKKDVRQKCLARSLFLLFHVKPATNELSEAPMR